MATSFGATKVNLHDAMCDIYGQVLSGKREDCTPCFPLARGRGKSSASSEELVRTCEPAKPHGLAEKKRSRHFQGFGYAVRELKEFQDRNSTHRKNEAENEVSAEVTGLQFNITSREIIDSCEDRTVKMISSGRCVIENENKLQLTSTPRVSHLNSFTAGDRKERYNSGSPTGSFLEASETQDSQDEFSTLNKGHLMSDKDSFDVNKSSISGIYSDGTMQDGSLKPRSHTANEFLQDKDDNYCHNTHLSSIQNVPHKNPVGLQEYMQHDNRLDDMAEGE